MNKSILIALTLIVLLVAGRIAFVKSNRSEIAEEPPVKNIELYKHWLTVKPEENTQISDFVDIKFFHDFSPGINFERATILHGNPNNIRKDKGNQYYEYWYDDARIEVGKEEYAQGDATSIDWALYSYPSKKTYSEILAPAISKHIDPGKEKNTVQILNSNGDVEMLVQIIGNRVDYMVWSK